LIAPGGAIILSGIFEHQVSDIVDSAEKHGVKLVDPTFRTKRSVF
jgi:ribosomal protein L11 methylase PrmA